MYHEFATFRNDDKIGLIELLQMKVVSKHKEVLWILVKRRHTEI